MSHWKLMVVAIVLAGCADPPESPEGLYRKGTALLETDPEKAIEYLTQSLQLRPNAPPAIYNRAVSYARVGRDAEAVADINHLEKVAPEIGRKLRAEIALSAAPYSDLGNREFEAANYYAYINRAELHHENKRLKAALADYTRAIELSPESPAPYYGRAAVHSDLRMPDEAARDTEKAAELKAKAEDDAAEST